MYINNELTQKLETKLKQHQVIKLLNNSDVKKHRKRLERTQTYVYLPFFLGDSHAVF